MTEPGQRATRELHHFGGKQRGYTLCGIVMTDRMELRVNVYPPVICPHCQEIFKAKRRRV